MYTPDACFPCESPFSPPALPPPATHQNDKTKQTNRSVDLAAPFLDEGGDGDLNAKQNGRSSWGRRHAPPRPRSGGEEVPLAGEDKTLEMRMEEELVAAQEAGGDVDRLVMKKLLAGVRDSGPSTAYKALASIEVRWVGVWCTRKRASASAYVPAAACFCFLFVCFV